MTDLEITKACAEAMGYSHHTPKGTDLNPDGKIPLSVEYSGGMMRYDPLHDDAQAMALVQKLGLDVQHYYWDNPVVSKHDAHGNLLAEVRNENLSRAICECVAKMQQPKQP